MILEMTQKTIRVFLRRACHTNIFLRLTASTARLLHDKAFAGLKEKTTSKKKEKQEEDPTGTHSPERSIHENKSSTQARNRVRDTTERQEYGDLGCESVDHYRSVGGR